MYSTLFHIQLCDFQIIIELLPMVSYFSDVVKDLKDRTQVATKVLMEGEGTAEVSLCDVLLLCTIGTTRIHDRLK